MGEESDSARLLLSLAGNWKISEKEADELKSSIREGWGNWSC